MKTCVGFMFWGVLLIALDFRFDKFDFVPNFVGGLGYALVAIGTGGLAPMSGNFIAACALGWLLVLASVAGHYIPNEAWKSFDVVMTVFNGAMMWTTLGGLRDIAVGRNRPQVAERTGPIRSAYIALVATVLVLGATVQGTSNATRALTAVVVLAAAIVFVLILQLLYRAWAELSP